VLEGGGQEPTASTVLGFWNTGCVILWCGNCTRRFEHLQQGFGFPRVDRIQESG